MKFKSAMPRAPQKQMPSRRQRRNISRHLTLRGAKKGRLDRLLKARTTLPQSPDARKVPLPATMGSIIYAFHAPGTRRSPTWNQIAYQRFKGHTSTRIGIMVIVDLNHVCWKSVPAAFGPQTDRCIGTTCP